MRLRQLATILALPAALLLGNTGAGAEEPLQVLEGNIVRSLAVHPEDPARILVGTKGSEPGSAIVLESRDGGQNWSRLNGGQPLNPEASDVQALAFGAGGEIFAGTWKQGLFRSRDQGAGFERDATFPDKDVRDLKLFAGAAPGIYAATGTKGVVRSLDDGKTWDVLGPEKAFVWSLTISQPSEAALYAVSPSSGVHGSIDQGKSWYRLFASEGAFAVDASDLGTDSFVVAGETGLHFSLGGQDWLRLPSLPEEKLSSILNVGGQAVLAGSWSDGVLVVDLDGGLAKRLLPGVPVVHIARAGSDLLVGTWGQGLYIFAGWFESS